MAKTAAYWEGWLALRTNRDCKYKDVSPDRTDWAVGFASAVVEERRGKVWWKSKTVRVGLALVVVGIGLWVFGQTNGDGGMSYATAGGGLTIASLVQIFLRTISSESVYFRRSYPAYPS